MSCQPSYSYRPTFTPSDKKCSAPKYIEQRARAETIFEAAMIPGDPETTGIFIRSRSFGFDMNNISVECKPYPLITDPLHFIVYYNNVIVETYSATTYSSITLLRNALDTNKSLVELTPILVDIKDDKRIVESTSMFAFDMRNLRGGSGPPTTAPALASIRTGPERSIIVITTTEDNEGNPTTPPAYKRVQQWNGFRWITYSNTVPGSCPYEGASNIK